MGLQAEREFNLANARYQPLVLVFVATCTGIAWDHYRSASLSVWFVTGSASLFIWSCSYWIGWSKVATASLLLAIACTGGSWHHLYWDLYSGDEIGLAATAEAAPICIEAIVKRTPRVKAAPPDDPTSTMPAEPRSIVAVAVTKVRDGRVWKSASGRTQVTIPGIVADVGAGDRVRIFGSLSSITPPLNPGEFNFANSQRQRRMVCRMSVDAAPCVVTMERSQWWHPMATIHSIRSHSNAVLAKNLPQDQAELASAILLGIRDQVDSERVEKFMTTGTVHLLAISGLHVGMLASGFWVIARCGWMSRKTMLLSAMALFVFYAIFTDAKPPVVRAAVLISVMCLARLLGRRAFEFNTLSFAGLILIVVNPTNPFQTGTQLSFLAVATLSCSQRVSLWLTVPDDPLQRLIDQSRPWPVRSYRRIGTFVWQLWVASTVIWIVALPLVMYRFHLVSPIAVFLNPVVWVPMAIALFSGFGVLVFGWAIPPLGAACGWICATSLSVIERCVAWTHEIPYGHAWVPSPPAWWILSFYVVLAIGVAVPRLRISLRWMIAWTTVWFAIGFAATIGPLARFNSNSNTPLACTFIAVGHGTSVLVELPDGRNLLYDAGSLGRAKFAVRPIEATLWSRRISHLDAIVISHADADHYNAIPGLLEKFSVGVVYVSPVMFRDATPALVALREAIRTRGVPIRTLDATVRLDGGDLVDIETLHPPPGGVLGSDNANSIVLQLRSHRHSLLLPGDLESPGLEDVMDEMPLATNIAMAPHHGSLRSDPLGFSAWATPDYVVISGGSGRDIGAVRWAYEYRGAQVFHTAVDGATRFDINSAGIAISTHMGSATKNESKED